MLGKRALALAFFLIGAWMVGFSLYIDREVAKGRTEISQAKETLRKGKPLFDFNPVTRQLGRGVEKTVHQKLSRYSQEADKYERIAVRLRMGGTVLIIVGIIIFWVARKRNLSQ